jgi:hypothetical protein
MSPFEPYHYATHFNGKMDRFMILLAAMFKSVATTRVQSNLFFSFGAFQRINFNNKMYPFVVY